MGQGARPSDWPVAVANEATALKFGLRFSPTSIAPLALAPLFHPIDDIAYHRDATGDDAAGRGGGAESDKDCNDIYIRLAGLCYI